MNQEIKKIVGSYKITNPYTQGNKKTLPFNVLGESYNKDYPVLVQTYTYRGKTRKLYTGNYTVEAVKRIINN